MAVKSALTLFQRATHSVAPMSGRTSALVTLALFAAMGIAAPAYPQDVSAPYRLCDSATADNEKPATPVSLDVDLDSRRRLKGVDDLDERLLL